MSVMAASLHVRQYPIMSHPTCRHWLGLLPRQPNDSAVCASARNGGVLDIVAAGWCTKAQEP
eukprot:CAMPEP_0202875010 /NCGR_PEP_ID=MMETSP1391-20130828/26441_1 /ASSEMBLY_ACC=CAM_ASM_000867 /TAXON_ID=1034604 /ORGANISM="Chlamydomonas leiostraca, Strain SAG 11-49" /LENGTH=61 /DNA_ID=CAMNT_0049556591 /DNA_START=2151 /DNA_END=2332 /DNA_ORIENTATION=-